MIEENNTIKQYKDLPLHYRENTGDLESIKDCFRNYKHLDMNENDVCIDLGANIGAFSYIASQKCKRVISVEASKSNFNMLSMNTDRIENVIRHNGAIVSDLYESDKIRFVTTNSKISSLSGKILKKDKPRADQHCEVIRAYKIGFMIDKYSPSVMKIDVEGAEYGILENVPECVKQISGELHGMTKDTRSKMFVLWEQLKSTWNVDFYEEKIMFGNPSLINFTIKR